MTTLFLGGPIDSCAHYGILSRFLLRSLLTGRLVWYNVNVINEQLMNNFDANVANL